MQSAKQIISNAGLRATKAREAVLSTILEADTALSHPEVIERISEKHHFDRVTVYRVLDWLTDNHLIHKIYAENRARKFRATHTLDTSHTESNHPEEGHSHAHLHCKGCEKILCMDELYPDFPQELLDKYEVTQVQVNLNGLCPDCKHKS